MKNRIIGHLALAAAVGLLAACSGQAPESDASAATATEQPTAAPEAAAEAPAATPANDVAAAPADAAAAGAAAHPGEETYKKTCAMCHATTALGAPMLGDKAEWGKRTAQGNDTLYQHALEGFTGEKGVMPAHGGNPGLSDTAVKDAVDYMVNQSQ